MTLWTVLALVAAAWLALGVLAAWFIVEVVWKDRGDDEDPPKTFGR